MTDLDAVWEALRQTLEDLGYIDLSGDAYRMPSSLPGCDFDTVAQTLAKHLGAFAATSG